VYSAIRSSSDGSVGPPLHAAPLNARSSQKKTITRPTAREQLFVSIITIVSGAVSILRTRCRANRDEPANMEIGDSLIATSCSRSAAGGPGRSLGAPGS
jgi:hypothetical protein